MSKTNIVNRELFPFIENATTFDRHLDLIGGQGVLSRLLNSKILVMGLDGTSTELVKNCLLMGMINFSFIDSNLVTPNDLSCCLFRPEDVGKKKCDSGLIQRLGKLNSSASLTFLSSYPEEFGDFEVVVVCNPTPNDHKIIEKIEKEDAAALVVLETRSFVGQLFTRLDEKNHEKFLKEGMKKGHEKRVTFTEFLHSSPNLSSYVEVDESGKRNMGNFDPVKCIRGHLFLSALADFVRVERHFPEPRKEEDVKLFLECCKKFSFYDKAGITTIDVIRFCNTSSLRLSPMETIFGAFGSHEILRIVSEGKFSIGVLVFNDMNQIEENDVDDRRKYESFGYGSQEKAFGTKFQEVLGALNIFQVGVGATGSENAKLLAMIGCGDIGNGCVHFTDMDVIEVTNLNRQFLYSQDVIGKFKSQIALDRMKEMNKKMKMKDYILRVQDSDEFPESFWDEVDVIISCVDNNATRNFLSEKCLLYRKLFLDSGISGFHGQIRIGHPDETPIMRYSEQVKRQIYAKCTIYANPHKPIHLIHWSTLKFREIFEVELNHIQVGVFDSLEFLTREIVCFQDCVAASVSIAEEMFSGGIKKAKLVERKVNLDVKSLDMSNIAETEDGCIFLKCCCLILSRCFEIDVDCDFLKGLFDEKKDKRSEKMNELMKKWRNGKKWSAKRKVVPTKIQKDDDAHICWLMSASNMRARNFNLNEFIVFNKKKTKDLAVTIGETIITPASLTQGFLVLELYRFVKNKIRGSNPRRYRPKSFTLHNPDLPNSNYFSLLEWKPKKEKWIKKEHDITLERGRTVDELKKLFPNLRGIRLGCFSNASVWLFFQNCDEFDKDSGDLAYEGTIRDALTEVCKKKIKGLESFKLYQNRMVMLTFVVIIGKEASEFIVRYHLE